MDGKEFKKHLYTYANTQREFADMAGYTGSSISQYISNKAKLPKPLLAILRLLFRNKQLEHELVIIKEYYGYPSDINFKEFLQKLGKHKK